MHKKYFFTFSLISIATVLYISTNTNYFHSQNNTVKASNKIAVLLPITGDASIYGESARNAALLADNGDKQIVIEDTSLNGQKALSALQKIEAQEKSKIKIAISFSSGETLALCPTTEKEHILLLSSGSSPAIGSCGEMTFSNFPSDIYQAGVLAEKLKDTKEISVLYLKNDYGTGIYNEFKNKYLSHNKDNSSASDSHKINTYAYLPGQTDYRTMLSSLKGNMIENNNSTILLISQPKEASIILVQAEQLGLSPNAIYGTDSLKDDHFASTVPKSLTNKLFVVSPKENLSDEQTDFQDQYRARFKTTPTAFADYVYDNIKLAIEALNACSPTGDDIKQNTCLINYIKDINKIGATGNISFGENRSARNKEYDFFKIVDGKFIVAK